MKRLTVVVGALCLLLCGPRPAAADVTVDGFRCTVSAQDSGENADDRSSGEIAGSDGYAAVASSDSGRSEHDTKVAAGTRSLTVTSKGTTVVTAGTNGRTDSNLDLRFTVTEEANFTLTAQYGAIGSYAEVIITLAGVPSSHETVRLLSYYDHAPTVVRTGTLAPGTYAFSIASGMDDVEAALDGLTWFDVQFVVATAATIRWKAPSSGDFSAPANWDPESPPELADVTVFDLPEAYTVTVGNRTTDQLQVRGGSPTLVEGDYTVANTEQTLDIAGGSVLTLGQGFALRGHRAVVGGTGGPARSQAILAHATSFWSLADELRIGEEGPGELTVHAGSVVAQRTVVGGPTGGGAVTVAGPASEFQTGDLDLAASEDGIFTVADGALVSSGVVKLGAASRAHAQARVSGGSAVSEDPTTWRAGSLEVLGASNCRLVLEDAAHVEVADFLRVHGSDATAGSSLVDVVGESARLTVRGNLYVGVGNGAGPALLRIRDGANMVCEGDLTITHRYGSPSPVHVGAGTVEVSGGVLTMRGTPSGSFRMASYPGVQGALRVTDAGRVVLGSTDVQVGGKVVVGDGTTACRFETQGYVQLSDYYTDATTELRVLPGSEVKAGWVSVHPWTLLTGGRRESSSPRAGAEPVSAPRISCPVLVNDGTVSAGALVVDGDYLQTDGGTLVVQIAGPDPESDQDRLVVTGAATLDGRLRLQFTNGYAPRQGDVFEVLDVTGAVSGAFTEVKGSGLQPGAQFDIAVTNGKLTATALGDGIALPVVSVKPGKAKKGKERRSKPASFVLRRTGDVSAALTVRIVVEGTADAGLDYEPLPSEVVIPAWRKSVKLPIVPIDDASLEGTETVAVRIVAGPDSTPGPRPAATVRIADDEKPPK